MRTLTTGEKIKQIRIANELTQEKMAEAIGISRPNLSGIERGVVQPTPVVVNCVSLLFGIPKTWLVNEKDEKLDVIKGTTNLIQLIQDKYEKLRPEYKLLVEDLINRLLEIQNNSKTQTENLRHKE